MLCVGHAVLLRAVLCEGLGVAVYLMWHMLAGVAAASILSSSLPLPQCPPDQTFMRAMGSVLAMHLQILLISSHLLSGNEVN